MTIETYSPGNWQQNEIDRLERQNSEILAINERLTAALSELRDDFNQLAMERTALVKQIQEMISRDAG